MPQPSAVAMRAVRLRWAAIGAVAFILLYALHRALQGLGPEGAEPAALAEWITAQRTPLLVSELALGAALLAFVLFVAPLVVVLREDGDPVTSSAFGLVGAVFIAMGLVSLTAETALFAADAGDAGMIAVLDALQARVPNVLAGAALAASIAPVFLRRRLAWRWLGVVSLVAAAVFALGLVFSVVGSAPETRGSIFGVAAFIVWMALVAAALWRSARVGSGTERGR
ncbi:hypothetical protein [Agromyces bauzanensis]